MRKKIQQLAAALCLAFGAGLAWAAPFAVVTSCGSGGSPYETALDSVKTGCIAGMKADFANHPQLSPMLEARPDAFQAAADDICDCLKEKVRATYPTIDDMIGVDRAKLDARREQFSTACAERSDKLIEFMTGQPGPGSGWSEAELQDFTKFCEQNARNAAAARTARIDAEAYCACAARELQKEFPVYADYEQAGFEQPEGLSEINSRISDVCLNELLD